MAEFTSIRLGGVNCYLVKTGDGFILIDTGYSRNRRDLEKLLEGAGCRPGNLKLILLTHGDFDHIGNAAYLRQKYTSKIAMHPLEAPAAENGHMLMSRKTRSFLARAIFSLMRLNKSGRFKPDLPLEEGVNLSPYGFDARVVHIPGHSLGSIGVLTAEGDLARRHLGAHLALRTRRVDAVARASQLRFRLVAVLGGDVAQVLRRARERLERFARGRAVLRARRLERAVLRVEVAPRAFAVGLRGGRSGHQEDGEHDPQTHGANVY